MRYDAILVIANSPEDLEEELKKAESLITNAEQVDTKKVYAFYSILENPVLFRTSLSAKFPGLKDKLVFSDRSLEEFLDTKIAIAKINQETQHKIPLLCTLNNTNQFLLIAKQISDLSSTKTKYQDKLCLNIIDSEPLSNNVNNSSKIEVITENETQTESSIDEKEIRLNLNSNTALILECFFKTKPVPVNDNSIVSRYLPNRVKMGSGQ